MADYNLSVLNSRSFEQFVPVLASKIIAPGILIFGDGPDGGREATYDGRIPFPSSAEQWDGYVVIQAKFLQKPQNPQSNARWLLAELRKELRAFGNRAKRRRMPEYYILVTNVVLSAVAKTGGKDKVDAEFKRFRKIRDWRIWDYDQLRAFLDGNHEVRRKYLFITPEDVLAEAFETLAGTRPDFERVMSNFLAKELLDDQYVNLEQAGHAVEDKIPLARVFVDLPVSRERLSEPLPDGRPHDNEPTNSVVIKLLAESSQLLNSSATIPAETGSDRDYAGGDHGEAGRFVLVGGPGQGKTTVGQFVCQLFRAALLETRPKTSLPQEVKETLRSIRSQCSEENLQFPLARRFPIRVVLNEFATALEKQPSMSLISYICHRISVKTDSPVLPVDVRSWLSAYPWILVLDGLDEVPASANRDEVLKRVEEFWVDATQVDADVLVLATTRPQGYNEDFSPKRYQHFWLVPLSQSAAMRYARRLVTVRYGESERRKKVLLRLEKAFTYEATIRLMRSPLQVTIMATLLDQIGQPPQDRWRLFQEYYRTIYRREMERPIPAAELLRKHQADVDTIHNRVALLLQIQSERSGGSEARLSSAQFQSVVELRLIEEGHTPEEVHRLGSRIIEASETRLVFLVMPQASQIGFEIRSIQEFMAAEALTQGKDDDVQERLRQIAPIASWRNVFLFAAGRCFANPSQQHLRDTVNTICNDLNNDLVGELGHAISAGSLLALELLEDGVVLGQPKYAKMLAECALKILDLPQGEVHGRLSDVCDSVLEVQFREEIEKRLTRFRTHDDRLGAWATLMPFLGRGVGWAQEFAAAQVPLETSEAGAILACSTIDRTDVSWLTALFESWIPTVEPSLARSIYSQKLGRVFAEMADKAKASSFWVNILEVWPPSRACGVTLRTSARLSEIPINIEFVPLHGYSWPAEADRDRREIVNSEWSILLEGARFAGSPSRVSLAQALKRVAEIKPVVPKRWIARQLPWVFAACIFSCKEAQDFLNLADRAGSGELADIKEWLAAETRWQQRGIDQADFEYATDDHWPFDSQIATRGFPFAASAFAPMARRNAYSATQEILYDLYAMFESYGCLSAELAEWLIRLLFYHSTTWNHLGFSSDKSPVLPSWLEPGLLFDLLKRSDMKFVPLDVIQVSLQQTGITDAWIEFFNKIGTSEEYNFQWYRGLRGYKDLLLPAFKRQPDKIGLLRIISQQIGDGIETDLTGFSIDCRKFVDLSAKSAAIVLQLASGIPKEDAENIARETLNLGGHQFSTIFGVMRAMEERESYTDAIREYFLGLWRLLKPGEPEVRRAIVESLSDIFRRRSSGLYDPAIYQRTSLPEGLLRLL
jgi:hypothetical protein